MYKIIVIYLLALCYVIFPLLTDAAPDESTDFDTAKKMYDMGNYENAIPLFQKAYNHIEKKQVFGQPMKYRDSEKLTDIQIYLGKSYKLLKKYEKALAEFEVIDGRLDGVNSCASYFAGEIYYLQGQTNSAEKIWKHAIKRSTDTKCLANAYVMHYIITKKKGLTEKLPWRLKTDKFLLLMVKFLEGNIPASLLIKENMTESQYLFANYIVGKMKLEKDQIIAAGEYFKRATNTDCNDCIGVDLAKKELNY